MPIEVIMPKVDMDMASGKIMAWHVAPGEAVNKGDALFDIETDKAAMEVEAQGSGILQHPVPEGTEIAIGQPVAWLYAKDEEVGERPVVAPSAADDEPEKRSRDTPVEPSVTDAASAPDHAVSTSSEDKTRATPLARSLAREAGLDIAAFAGTGPRGRVQGEDVRSALDDSVSVDRPVSFASETGPLSVTRSRGGEGRPVVLIHGFTSDATSWAPLESHLANRPLIRIDLPGHGKSPKRRISDFAGLVKDVREAFDGLDVEQAHLIGHSLGGAVCLALADTRARSVASLTLIAPAGLGPDIDGAVIEGICRASRPESLGPWLKSLVADESIVTDSYIRIAMAARSDATLRAAQAAMAGALFPDGVQAFDLRAALHRLDLPTRILWGRQDAVIPWRHALRAPGRVALHLFDGVGHMPQIERADDVGKIVGSDL